MRVKKGYSPAVFRLPKEAVACIEEIAKARYMSKSSVLTQIVMQWMENPVLSMPSNKPKKRSRKKRPNGAPDVNDHS